MVGVGGRVTVLISVHSWRGGTQRDGERTRRDIAGPPSTHLHTTWMGTDSTKQKIFLTSILCYTSFVQRFQPLS